MPVKALLENVVSWRHLSPSVLATGKPLPWRLSLGVGSNSSPWQLGSPVGPKILLWEFLEFLRRALASLVAQMVKNPPAMQELQVWSLGQEDHLKKGMATHSSILAWKIIWIEEPGRLQFMGSQRRGQDWVTNTNRRDFRKWWGAERPCVSH